MIRIELGEILSIERRHDLRVTVTVRMPDAVNPNDPQRMGDTMRFCVEGPAGEQLRLGERLFITSETE